jgi:hypothetical protein
MILPYVRLGASPRIAKAAEAGRRRKENVTIAVNAARFTFLWAAALPESV